MENCTGKKSLPFSFSVIKEGSSEDLKFPKSNHLKDRARASGQPGFLLLLPLHEDSRSPFSFLYPMLPS